MRTIDEVVEDYENMEFQYSQSPDCFDDNWVSDFIHDALTEQRESIIKEIEDWLPKDKTVIKNFDWSNPGVSYEQGRNYGYNKAIKEVRDYLK